MSTKAILYTFCGVNGLTRVCRLTTGRPNDWHTWHEQFLKDNPISGDLLTIDNIRLIDERDVSNVENAFNKPEPDLLPCQS